MADEKPKGKRLTPDVPAEVYERMMRSRVDDGIGPTVRLRLLAMLWAEDVQLQQRISELGREERAAGRLR